MPAFRRNASEGLSLVRLMMVLSSLCPLFVLWAIRGSSRVQDLYFIGVCLLFAILPTAFLYVRIRVARRELRRLYVGATEDHRSHVLVYLFATLLPFYREQPDEPRELVAMCVALAFIVFLFYRLDLHYINVLFALFCYQVHGVWAPADDNPHTDREKCVIITRRTVLRPGDSIRAYRITKTVYLEME